MKIILASQSPRRRELMTKITQDFTVCVSDVDETLPAGISPTHAVALLAEKKAEAVYSLPQYADCCVIGADTVVEAQGQILGKPRDAAQAEAMLTLLSGGTHTVHTGLCVLSPLGRRSGVVSTQVDFYPLTPDQISRYVASGEPMGKAGSYGIQGQGALLVRGIRGDFYNVVGFPVATLYRLMGELGVLSD